MLNLTPSNNRLLTKAEEHKLLNELNNKAFEYPKNKSLIDLFEDQVKKTPANTAIIFEDLELSYRELNKLSNQFAYTWCRDTMCIWNRCH
ncbi:MAG: putative non-ribosomal peptide synthase [Mucilaginibacter sp.]|nr:putative non-ribosomal peptide synthase [Mucilaginibacter sp.]